MMCFSHPRVSSFRHVRKLVPPYLSLREQIVLYAVAAADGEAYSVAITAAVTSTTVWYAHAATFTKLNFCFMLVDMSAE